MKKVTDFIVNAISLIKISLCNNQNLKLLMSSYQPKLLLMKLICKGRQLLWQTKPFKWRCRRPRKRLSFFLLLNGYSSFCFSLFFVEIFISSICILKIFSLIIQSPRILHMKMNHSFALCVCASPWLIFEHTLRGNCSFGEWNK